MNPQPWADAVNSVMNNWFLWQILLSLRDIIGVVIILVLFTIGIKWFLEFLERN